MRNNLFKQEILELKKLQRTDDKEKYLNQFSDETYKEDAKVRFNIIKNSSEFRDSLPKIDLISMKLQFISPEAVRKLAVTECQVYDLTNIKGLNSIKMGSSVKKDVLCQTCSLNRSECTGHLGYIELAQHFIHPLAIDFTRLVLECVCEGCGYLNLTQDNKKKFLKLNNKETYKKLKDISRIVKNSGVCINASGTGAKKCYNTIPKNKVSYETSKTIDGTKITKTIKMGGGVDNTIVYIDVKEIKEIFKKISNQDLYVMGFENGSTPVNFILEALPVIPERDRPPIRLKNEEKQDDLTIVYQSVLKNNINLKKELIQAGSGGGGDEQKINAYKKQLWNEIKSLMNNNKGLKKINSTAIAKTLNTKLSGKKGYCRKGSQSKRVDYAGRSVIGGAISEFGWVILPDKFKHMTIKENVFEMNIERIKNMARNKQIYKIIKKGISNEFYYDKITQFQIARRKANPDQTRVNDNDVDNIEIGDTVYRNLTLGDDVYINRQPSLHRHSMIGCRTNFFKNKNTVQIHMSYTKPLNADFDGDEMNVNVPQTITARAELRHLLNATKQIISVGNSNPIMFLLFNDPTSAYLISKEAELGSAQYEIISKEEEKEIVNYFFNDKAYFDFEDYKKRIEKYKVKRRTPQALFSFLFPKDFWYQSKSGNTAALIKEGIYLGGKLEKEDVSSHLIHSLYIKYGSPYTSHFISKGRFLLDFFIERRGFTIGLKDMILTNTEKKEKFEKIIKEVRERVMNIEKKIAYTDLEKRFKQQQIIDALSTPIDNEFGKSIAEEANNTTEDNNLVTMVKSKAKGDFKNITRIMSTVGQQVVHQQRPAKTIYGNRTICYFDVGDNSIESRGFSVNGFTEGLLPAAEFFQSQESRIGLLNTALETAEIGALTKRISKVVESEVVNYDGGIVDANGNYTSLSYDDGYNREELIKVEFESTGKMFLPFDIRMILGDLELL